MVVWLFAGGGESEVQGLVPFLRKHFPPEIRFDRKTPVKRKPGPKADKKFCISYGKTGKSLAREIRERLRVSLEKEVACDFILVVDDLDCRALDWSSEMLVGAVIHCFDDKRYPPFIIGFAAPEIEAWFLGDWANTFGRHPDFSGKRAKAMAFELNHAYGANFSRPEEFGEYDPDKDSCDKKLSDCIINASINAGRPGDTPFAKARHTPELLSMLEPEEVSTRCPCFRQWWNELKLISSDQAR